MSYFFKDQVLTISLIIKLATTNLFMTKSGNNKLGYEKLIH